MYSKYIERFKTRIVPNSTTHLMLKKGDSGRYSGAPFFTAISSMRSGADLVYLFTTASAAASTKSLSPDIITIPLLPSNQDISDENLSLFKSFSSRFTSLVIGPGITRNEDALNNLILLLGQTQLRDIPLVIDADALWIVKKAYTLISSFKAVILTPNCRELSQLYRFFEIEDFVGLQTKLGVNFFLLCKGITDIILDTDTTKDTLIYVEKYSSSRRCGGQGDILSGVLGTFCSWASSQSHSTNSDIICAMVLSSLLVRLCSNHTYLEKGRSMLASDMISNISVSYKELLDK